MLQSAAATRRLGFVDDLVFGPLPDPDKTGFGSPSLASKFPLVEFSLISQHNPVHELLPHLVSHRELGLTVLFFF